MTRAPLTVVPPTPPLPPVSEAADKGSIAFHAVNVRLPGQRVVEVLVSTHGALVRCWSCEPFCEHEQAVNAWLRELKAAGKSLPWLTPLYDQDAVTP